MEMEGTEEMVEITEVMEVMVVQAPALEMGGTVVMQFREEAMVGREVKVEKMEE